jgi:hypothetical protein
VRLGRERSAGQDSRTAVATRTRTGREPLESDIGGIPSSGRAAASARPLPPFFLRAAQRCSSAAECEMSWEPDIRTDRGC